MKKIHKESLFLKTLVFPPLTKHTKRA